MSARAWTLACVAAGAFTSLPAWSCGACIEDKIAVTYDDSVIRRAAQRHEVVVFASIEGPGNPHQLAKSVKAAALHAPGIARDSVRTVADPAAVSFALDPRVAAPEATLAALEQARPGLKLAVLRIVR
jgi:hypothetical protein